MSTAVLLAFCLQVHLGAVQLSNTAVVNKIWSLEPYTISWSNVPDYIHPADFHRLAQAISAPSDTVHFMHRYVPQVQVQIRLQQELSRIGSSLKESNLLEAACCACVLDVPYMHALLCTHADLHAPLWLGMSLTVKPKPPVTVLFCAHTQHELGGACQGGLPLGLHAVLEG